MNFRFQSYHLEPVRKSKFNRLRNCLRSHPPIKAFKLNGTPQSAEEIFAMFHQFHQFHQSRKQIILWIGDGCFVHDGSVARPKDYLLEFKWVISNKEHAFFYPLYICCMTLEGMDSCMGTLFEPTVSSFERSMLGWSPYYTREQKLCPLSCEILAKFIVQNQKGTCEFSDMIFTPAQCRTLATCGRKTSLAFYNCRFQDGGMAFMDAYLSLDNDYNKRNAGPAKLEFSGFFGNLFAVDDPRLTAFLYKLPDLRLVHPRNNFITDPCRAVACITSA